MNFITPQQSRAARGLLNWSQPELARRCDMHKQTISNFEAGRSTPSKSSLEKLTKMLENGGVEFGGNNGVSLPSIKTITYDYKGWFVDLQDDVIFTLSHGDYKKELLIYGADDRVTPPPVYEKFNTIRRAGIQMREMVCEGNLFVLGPEEEYRWIPKKLFQNYNTVIYGNKMCVDFKGSAAILIINDGWAETERNKFEMLWAAGLPLIGKSTSKIRYC